VAASKYLTKDEQAQIVKAIESAELNTSGEIRVHLESLCNGDPFERAVYLFNKLKMHKTKDHNGVLIYVAFESKKFAIIGDSGINEKVPDNFWDREKELLLSFLREGEISKGLISVIEIAGNNLKSYFPYQTDDTNEQSNEISFGE
jgi:uncharacterized membrane protein